MCRHRKRRSQKNYLKWLTCKEWGRRRHIAKGVRIRWTDAGKEMGKKTKGETCMPNGHGTCGVENGQTDKPTVKAEWKR